MAEIIGIFDCGLMKHQGHNVAVIKFTITNNEGKPEEMIGYCNPAYRDSIIKNLKRLNFEKSKAEKNDTGRDAAS
jgi:hypothetical protein